MSSPPRPSFASPSKPSKPQHLLRALLHLTLWLAHLAVANTLLSLLLPVSLLLPTPAYNASSRLAGAVWAHIQHIFTRVNGARILVAGDALPAGESAIVVSNHVEWTDFYLIQELALRAGMLGRCRWFAKKQLRWVPFLGWGLWAMGMPLVSRNWAEDEAEMKRVFDGVVERKWPLWLISFSESTRLTPSKRASASAYAQRTGKAPPPPHLLLPRTKGFAACVQHLRAGAPHVRAVYDVTVAYADMKPGGGMGREQGKGKGKGRQDEDEDDDDKKRGFRFRFQAPPTFAQSVLTPRIGERWKMVVHVRRFEISQLPGDEGGLKAWLEARWGEKGEVLEGLRRGLVEEEERDGGGWEGREKGWKEE